MARTNTNTGGGGGGNITGAGSTPYVTLWTGPTSIGFSTHLEFNESIGEGQLKVGNMLLWLNSNGGNPADLWIGESSGRDSATSAIGGNTGVGYFTGAAMTTGSNNSFFGGLAGNAITTGDENLIMGFSAGKFASTTSRNVALGNYAGQNMVANGANVAIGWSAASQYTGGNGVYIGYEAGNSAANSGFSNVVIGYQAANLNSSGNNNTFVGTIAAQDNTTGSFNTALGAGSGVNNTTGDSNVMIGAETGNAGAYSSSIAIGRNVYISADNQLLFGSSLYPIYYAAIGAYTGAGNNLWWEYDDANERFSNNAHGSNISAQSGKKFALTNTVDTPIFRFVLVDGEAVGGSFNIVVTIKDAGGNAQVFSDIVTFAATQSGGTPVVQITHSGTQFSKAATSGTLATLVYTSSSSGGYLTISVNANTSLTPTELNAQINIINIGGTANHSVTFL